MATTTAKVMKSVVAGGVTSIIGGELPSLSPARLLPHHLLPGSCHLPLTSHSWVILPKPWPPTLCLRINPQPEPSPTQKLA